MVCTKTKPSAIDAYLARINDLKKYGVEDSYEASALSEFDFWKFIHSNPDYRRANLVLLENGNFRATWKDTKNSQLGVEFLGNCVVRCVIFKNWQDKRELSTAYRKIYLSDLKLQIKAFEMDEFLRE